MPASTTSGMGTVAKSKRVTMPKLPPPPRSAHSRSGSAASSTWTRLPSARTTSAPTRRSQVRPCARMSQPMPPPSVRPARPVVVLMPIGTATPCGTVAASRSPSSAPGSTLTRVRSALSSTPRRSPWSITTPSSTRALPDTLWPPPMIETGRPCSRAKVEGALHILGAGAAGKQRRPAVDHPVPDAASLLVARLAGQYQLACERSGEGIDVGAAQPLQLLRGHGPSLGRDQPDSKACTAASTARWSSSAEPPLTPMAPTSTPSARAACRRRTRSSAPPPASRNRRTRRRAGPAVPGRASASG